MTGTNKIQSLNYSTHALEELEAMIPHIHWDKPLIRSAHQFVAKQLRDSVKFVLPNCAELVDMSELRQAHVDMARLPYPVVALEAPWVLPNGSSSEKYKNRPSSRRIALCMTLCPEVAEWLPSTKRFWNEELGGVVVIPLFWDDKTAEWHLSLGGAFVPYENEVSAYVPGETSLVNRLMIAPYQAGGFPIDKLRHFRVSPFIILSEMWPVALTSASKDEVMARILCDATDEVSMLLQTGVVLNCANVTTAEIAAPKMLNQKRKAKGKTPFFSYRVLQVSAPRKSGGKGGGGQHASPRAHLRRGHIRRLEEKTIWVRPAVVNPGAGASVGVVQKEYAIAPPVAGRD
jgi:hypothetical protein